MLRPLGFCGAGHRSPLTLLSDKIIAFYMPPPLLALLPSRLGTPYPPLGSSQLNLGVEQGSQALYDSFLSQTSLEYQVFRADFPEPEELHQQDYLKELLALYQDQAKQLAQAWQSHQPLLTLGGDHSVSYLSLLTALRRWPNEQLAVLIFDSHADLHTPATSPSGNFHGMWLRALFPHFAPTLDISAPLQPRQLRFIGHQELESAEHDFISRQQLPVYRALDLAPAKCADLITWTQGFPHLHLSFDVDVVKSDELDTTGMLNSAGLSFAQLFPLLSALCAHPSLSLDIVEFNPTRGNKQKGLALLSRLFKLFDQHAHSTSSNNSSG